VGATGAPHFGHSPLAARAFLASRTSLVDGAGGAISSPAEISSDIFADLERIQENRNRKAGEAQISMYP
jgi:hypothetical protein